MSQITLDGYPLNVQSYKVTRQAKYEQYSIPNTDLDTILPMTAYNRIHHLELTATSDIDAENILQILQNTSHTLVDESGFAYTVTNQQMINKLQGGQKGVYNFILDFIDDGQVSKFFSTVFFSPIVTVSQDTREDYEPRIMYVNNLFWLFYNSNSFYYTTSSDGIIWSPTSQIASSGLVLSSTWLTGSTLYYVRALPIADSNIYFRYGNLNSDSSISWLTSEKTIPISFSGSGSPYILQDKINNLWVAFMDDNLFSPGSATIIKSTDNGNSWSFITRFSCNTYVHPWLGQFSNGDISIVYGTGGLGVGPIFVSTTKDGGISWSTSIATSTSGPYEITLSGITILNDKIFIVAFDQLEQTFDLLTYTHDAPSWSVKTNLVTRVSSATLPYFTLTTDGNKTLSSFFMSSATQMSEIHSHDSGVTWSQVTNFSVSLPSTLAVYPSMPFRMMNSTSTYGIQYDQGAQQILFSYLNIT